MLSKKKKKEKVEEEEEEEGEEEERARWGGRGRSACNFKNVICTKSKLTQEERPL